ncbi:MAG TPA: SDR family oxidoreductase [Jatrophihabitantaceae bacterium]|jgi:NAD(P)-dependent dehydrogenase (short-subunit alcohol dehydrogenase family)|nr:SDR family oxidoreductase [Jatrophihabitantaceae bacterium]
MTRIKEAPVALVTGASRGFGRALASALLDRGWRVVLDARDAEAVRAASVELPEVVAVRGDVTDPLHRESLAAAIEVFGGLDLLVNNASTLGPSPLPPLTRYPLYALRRVFETNVVAPLALVQLLAPMLRARAGVVVNLSSDAAVEAYEGWGGYGMSKAALDQLTAVAAIENPDLRMYSFDPGDMRTAMHQDAFPDEDISDRPEPATVVPTLLRLLDLRPPSGRYRASDLVEPAVAR